MRSVLRVAAFPALVFGGTALAWWSGDLGLPPEVALAGVPSVAAVLIAALERAIPYEAAWARSRGDVGTDVVHLLVSMIAVPRVYEMTVTVALGALATRVAESWGGAAAWPTGWPVAAQIALALVVGEIGSYWIHRWTHTVPLLWRVHAIHHSAPRLYWLNVARVHPIDVALALLFQTGPLVLLGCPPQTLALTLVLGSVHGMLQHSNADLRLGPLNWVFSNAELHRFHHARDARTSNHNYGQTLIVWDLVFGTFLLPKDRRPDADVGLPPELSDYPQTWVGHLRAPFR